MTLSMALFVCTNYKTTNADAVHDTAAITKGASTWSLDWRSREWQTDIPEGQCT